MSVREQYVRDRDAYLQKKDEEAVIADQLVEKQLTEKKARSEQIAPQVPSDKYCLICRFDATDREHKEIALLHPTRFHNSEESGKMLRFLLPREADPVIENRIQRQGSPGPGIFPRYGEWPNTLALPPATIEDALLKKIATVFELGKQSLQNIDPRKVIAATMESLRKLQTLDGRFPRPLTEKSLHGILGDFVQIAHPTVVASREMLLYEMLPLLGVLLGDSFYLPY